MFDFCPHCGQTIEAEQVVGRMLVCGMCGKDIGFVGAVQRVAGDETEARIRAGTATRCPVCQQAVDVKSTGSAKTLVPHYGSTSTRKICPGSSKPIASTGDFPLPPQIAGRMTRDVIKIVACTRSGVATI